MGDIEGQIHLITVSPHNDHFTNIDKTEAHYKVFSMRRKKRKESFREEMYIDVRRYMCLDGSLSGMTKIASEKMKKNHSDTVIKDNANKFGISYFHF